MKKKVIALMLAIIISPVANVYAAFVYLPAQVPTYTTFAPWRDEYRTDFAYPNKSTWSYMRLYFETAAGAPHEKVWTVNEIQGRIMFLTCNGTYQFQFLNSVGDPVAWSELIHTQSIQNPPCNSYQDGGARNDLGAQWSNNPSGGYDLSWQDVPGATEYEIWQNGQLVGTVPAGQGSYHVPGQGSTTIVARDGSGNIIGESDLQVPEYDGQPDYGNGSGGCSMCDKIDEMLQCPGWDLVMGDLTDAIRDALPPPPDWHEIAGIFVEHFADYFGDVPAPPSVEDMEWIKPDMPDVDLTIPGSEIMPDVPPGYEQPLEFDITDAPVIPVVDESKPFEILEPDHYIDADEPGTFVFPDDPRNDSRGIKAPDQVDTGAPTPAPTKDSGNETPPSDTPMPNIPETETPSPSIPGSIIPIPTDPRG